MEFLQEELDEILNIFAQEGAEILQSMDKNLLLLEKRPNDIDVAMHLFRDAHSLKGSARMLGFNGIQNIAHKIEDVLGLIREGKLKVNSNITDTISDALACIDKLINSTGDSSLCFKPLMPSLEAGVLIAWKKNQPLSGCAKHKSYRKLNSFFSLML